MSVESKPSFRAQWLSRFRSAVTVLSWGLTSRPKTFFGRLQRLKTLSRQGFDKIYYQREAHDVRNMHPVVHFLDQGEAAGLKPLPPRPSPTLDFPVSGSAAADRLLQALSFRPPPIPLSVPTPSSKTVDVIMPCFNRQETISRAIRSVFAQSHPVHRLILVDDGSTDNSVEIVTRDFAAEIRSGTLVLTKADHGGVSVARNRGLSQVTSDFVAYLDSDNIWTPDHLDTHINGIVGTGSWWSYGSMIEGEAGMVRGNRPYDRFALLQENWIDLNVMVHHAQTCRRVGGFDTRLKRLVDHDLALRLGRLGPPLHIDRPTASYSASPDAISRTEAFLPARQRVRLSHVMERISWGLIKPRVYCTDEALIESVDRVVAEGRLQRVKDTDEADLIISANPHTLSVEFEQMGHAASVLITDELQTVQTINRSRLAVALIAESAADGRNAEELSLFAACHNFEQD